MALSAKEDKPDPKEMRPILNIQHHGTIIAKRKTYYAPDSHDSLADPYSEVKDLLVAAAAQMEKAPLNDDGTGAHVPDDPVLVRADQSTPFKHIQKVMEMCGLPGIQIWKVQLAASVPGDDQ